MKLLKKSLLLALFSVLFTQVQASPLTLSPQEDLVKQVTKIVSNADAWGDISEEAVLKISFTVNAEGEITVLATDSKEFDSIAKDMLNNQKVEVDKNFINKVFILPVRLAQE